MITHLTKNIALITLSLIVAELFIKVFLRCTAIGRLIYCTFNVLRYMIRQLLRLTKSVMTIVSNDLSEIAEDLKIRSNKDTEANEDTEEVQEAIDVSYEEATVDKVDNKIINIADHRK